MLKIYGRANSINVRKVLWLCDEIGLSYTREDWGRGFRATSEPEFLALNPMGLVPVIDDEGFLLRESNAIVRYLASKYGYAEIYPNDLKQRAIIEQWMDWGAAEFVLPQRGAFLGGFIKVEPWTTPWFVEAAQKDFNRLMTLLDAHLKASGKAFVAGDAFTVADIPVGLVVNRWYTLELERPTLPSLAAYYDKLSQRPAYQTHGRNGAP
ncbi:MAG: glutathione S-transferase family protein [Hyphomicrobiaceae bacterium]|nr:glutathione S-transferase family protein [Hyphomicrobiaceae bacterium]